MDIVTADTIGKKSKALKHCDKLIAEIDKKGFANVKLNCTGVEFTVRKDDAIYCRVQATKYALLDEIRSFELTTRAKRALEQPIRKIIPAPVGAAPAQESEEEKIRRKRAKNAEYQRRHYAKMKAKKESENKN